MNGIWIRIQEGETLCFCDCITVHNKTIDEERYCVEGSRKYSALLSLGIYSSKSRALEVLDEIQVFIHDVALFRDQMSTTVYRMPEE